MNAIPEWTFNDGWILMSVFLTQGVNGASLDEVLGAADVMNHAIPTSGELSRALTRLASRGILTEEGDRFRIFATHLPSIAEANQGKSELFGRPDKGKRWLSRMQFDVDDAIRVSITDEQLALAFDLYCKRFRQKKLTNKRIHAELPARPVSNGLSLGGSVAQAMFAAYFL